MKFKILLIIYTFMSFSVSTQVVFYQDIFHGGITGAGFSTGTGNGSGAFDIHIEPGSTIRKAYLFTYSMVSPQSFELNINNSYFYFDNADATTTFSHTNPDATPIKLFVKDITSSINPVTTNFTVNIPLQNYLLANKGFWSVYMLVIYEKPSLSKSSIALILNNQDQTGSILNNITDLNSINNSYPVGFSIFSDRTMNGFPPTKNVFFNSNYIGTVGGSDNINNGWSYAGVKGHFYYQNQSLFGLDDDTPNSYMNSTDALADVSSYLTNNTTVCNFKLQHIDYPNQQSNSTSINLSYFLSYTTPCDTFSVSASPDTTICYGETLQLQASGGQSYEWSASTASQDTSSSVPGLSCSDCPNPIFTGDHSMSYSVRIWNNDSCSVVRPVRINVSRPQKVSCYTGETKCGASTGYIKANALPEDLDAWYVVTPNNDTLDQPIGNTFPNLGAGDYSVYYIDSLGCKSEDTIVTIEAYNNTVADFSVNPTTGSVPLEVEINNQSQNATDFEWLINGVSSGTSPTTFFDTSGVYEIGLVAWEIDASCADTTWKTVLVFDSLMAQLPNVFTPNNDGTNDFFNVKVNLPVSYKLSILNRWGNVVFENEGGLAEGTHKLWDGTAENGDFVTDGTYFYTISFALDKQTVDCEVTECEVRKDGFVQVFGE